MDTVAQAIRIEYNDSTDTMYIVFEIVDEHFKSKIRQDWTQDIELKLIGRSLKNANS